MVYDIFETNHSAPLKDPMWRRMHPEALLNDTVTCTGHVLRMSFVNTSHPKAVASDAEAGTTNHFIGNDSTKWVTGARSYSDVRIQNLYEGIDAVFCREDDLPRYYLVLQPGADPSQFAMKFEGQDALLATASDDFTIKTSMGDIEECGLYAYQLVDEEKRQVACGFEIAENGKTSFHVGNYDRTEPLVIDPLLYSTCLGGNKDEVVQGMGLAVDRVGNAYATGGTYSAGIYPRGYPTTTGAFQTDNHGSSDV